LVIRSWAAGVLHKGKSLATYGPYSLCKHPLYLGSFSMMLGFCLLMGNLLHWAAVFGPMAVIYWLTMLREERRLAVKFGDAWTSYSRRVPRFLPWRWVHYRHAPFNWALWMSSREYKALLTAIVGLVALEVWRLY
jgi:protein-S-isoprenylcysteine O-methyltransferase Ste14